MSFNTYCIRILQLFSFLCFVDRASWYKLTQWPTWCTLASFLQYVHYNPLYVSSITCSSSGG